MANPPPGGYSPLPPPKEPISTKFVVQPVVVKPVQPQRSHGLLGTLNSALETAAKELEKAVDDVTHLSTRDRLQPGCVVQLQSRLAGKSLRILENYAVDCLGVAGTACHYRVVAGNPATGGIKLQSVAMPHCFIAIVGGYLVGSGRGGDDCDFLATITMDDFATFESLSVPGAHIGALPSGAITAPGQTVKSTQAAHFRVKYIGKAV